MLDLLVRGGDVVTPQGVGQWDVAIEGERIVALALPEQRLEASRVMDATGKIGGTGVGEPHTHLAHFISLNLEENHQTREPEANTPRTDFVVTSSPIVFYFPPREIDT